MHENAEPVRPRGHGDCAPISSDAVCRYLPLVYSAARRQVGDCHAAEDVTQGVFLLLVRRRAKVEAGRLPGWLLRATRWAARDALRQRRRREGAEMRAAQMKATQAPAAVSSQPTWEQIAPLIDAAVDKLKTRERDAVVLRFWENMSLQQVGEVLGISEDAAGQRVTRGLAKLRRILMRQGVAPSPAVLGALLGVQAVQAVPAGLAASVTAAVSAGTVSVSAVGIAEGVRIMMVWAKIKVAAIVLFGAVILTGTGLLLVGQLLTPGASPAERAAATVPASDATDQLGNEPVSAWFVLHKIAGSGTGTGLLHGLAARLHGALDPARLETPLWKGVPDGGSLRLDIQVEGGVKGDIVVGFFSDPRWYLAEPVQVRRFPGPGQYTVDGLPPGRFVLGAMMGQAAHPDAMGIHESWPAPVQIAKDEAAQASVLLSKEFEAEPDAMGAASLGFLELPAPPMPNRPPVPTAPFTVRTVDSQGRPVPFCRISVAQRWAQQPQKVYEFHQTGTNARGSALMDKFIGPFSITAYRRQSDPAVFTSRGQSRRFARIYDTQDRPDISVTWEPFPVGTGTATGQVRDQYGRLLKGYCISLVQDHGDRVSMDDYTSFSYHMPVIDREGRYRFEALPSGTYRASVRSFDYMAFADSFEMARITIPPTPNAVVETTIPIEAKELLYGRILRADGKPPDHGGYTIPFERRDPQKQWWRAFSWKLEPDGSFRVCLSWQERLDCMNNCGGMVEISEGSRKMGQVQIDKLSKDAARPTEIVFDAAAAETRAESRGSLDGERKSMPGQRPAIIDDQPFFGWWLVVVSAIVVAAVVVAGVWIGAKKAGGKA